MVDFLGISLESLDVGFYFVLVFFVNPDNKKVFYEFLILLIIWLDLICGLGVLNFWLGNLKSFISLLFV